VIGELVAGRVHDDALEVFGFYVSVSVPVVVLESLPNTLTLQTAQHLGELRVCEVVPVPLHAEVERRPIALPFERYRLRGFVLVVELYKVVPLDHARPLDIEESESDFVFGVGLR